MTAFEVTVFDAAERPLERYVVSGDVEKFDVRFPTDLAGQIAGVAISRLPATYRHGCGATWTLPTAPEQALCPNCNVWVPRLDPPAHVDGQAALL